MEILYFGRVGMIALKTFWGFAFFHPGCYVQMASSTSGGSFLHNNAYYCAINGPMMAFATQSKRSVNASTSR